MLNRTQSGFSLVELMLAVTIMGIVLGVGAPSYSNWIANSRTRDVADGLLGGLQLARAEAVSRNAQVRLAVNADLSWSVGCVTVTTDCPAAMHSRSSEGTAARVTLALTLANTTVTAGPGTVAFDSLGYRAGANPIVQLDTTVPTTILPASESRDLRIIISPSGHVRLCDPALPSANPQACA